MANPVILAGMLRQQAGATTIPVSLSAILEWAQIVYDEVPLQGCLGLFARQPKHSGILIAEGQLPGQRRFTIAHELGHFAMPTHGTNGPLRCLYEDMASPPALDTIEREANTFAAELLMPRASFGAAIEGKDLSFQLVKQLASEENYYVSLTACALRLVELTNEPCALICSENGSVVWQRRSRNFFYTLPSKSQSVPSDSIAACVARGEPDADSSEEIDPAIWITPRENVTEVFESAILLPRVHQVLSILSVIEES